VAEAASQAVPAAAVNVAGRGPAVRVKLPLSVPGDVNGIVVGAITGPLDDSVTVSVTAIESGLATPDTVTVTVDV
jgi:hypothetical protein